MAPRRILLAALLAAASPAAAQQIARSPGPDAVGVTVYRAPDRPAGQRMQLGWLGGYALISETRRVTVPAGESQLRFEGVSGGILPETAIVTGFPADVIEKNQDAKLLSPGSLLDAALGKRVHLRRTSRATGQVRETEAIVRSGEGGAVVLQTAEGYEALRCTGLPETLRYDEVPADLSAKPTLSVRVRAAKATTATIKLSYLASGFDWQANYIATLSPDGTRADLFAWLTLANGEETSFRNADTNAVAGRLNRENIRAPRAEARPLTLECWAQGTTTSDLREEQHQREEIVVTGTRLSMMAPPPPPPPPPPPMAVSAVSMMAVQEELGDLKLYRIPKPVTVAAKSQKQVALLERRGVKVEQVYRHRLYLPNLSYPQPVSRVIVARNTAAGGLGLPLPAGRVMLSARASDRPLLIGRGTMSDYAVGEDVEIVVGQAVGLSAEVRPLAVQNGAGEWELAVSNAAAVPARYEVLLQEAGYILRTEASLPRKEGHPLWAVTVPANGTASLRFRTEAPPRR